MSSRVTTFVMLGIGKQDHSTHISSQYLTHNGPGSMIHAQSYVYPTICYNNEESHFAEFNVFPLLRLGSSWWDTPVT